MSAPARQRFVRRADRPVAAVQLALETDGLTYRKWGGEQHAKAGDWLVDNDGDVYTVDGDVFARTYRSTATGAYIKVTPVWAVRAASSGEVRTKEGTTRYAAGDYLVSNDREGTDQWAMTAAAFESLYAPSGQ
jgi:hypothetical protein